MRSLPCSGLLLVSLLFLPATAWSEDTDQERDRTTSDFWKYFSPGLTVNWFVGGSSTGDLVGDAEIRAEDSVVEVTKRNNVQTALALQAVLPLFCDSATWVPGNTLSKDQVKLDMTEGSLVGWSKKYESFWGLYVAPSVSKDDVLDNVGFGLAYTRRYSDWGYRIGGGVVVDEDAQRLVDDLVEGEMTNRSSIEYVEEFGFGFQFLITFVPGFDVDEEEERESLLKAAKEAAREEVNKLMTDGIGRRTIAPRPPEDGGGAAPAPGDAPSGGAGAVSRANLQPKTCKEQYDACLNSAASLQQRKACADQQTECNSGDGTAPDAAAVEGEREVP